MMIGLLECLEADGAICQEEGFKQEPLVIDRIVDNPPGGGLITWRTLVKIVDRLKYPSSFLEILYP